MIERLKSLASGKSSVTTAAAILVTTTLVSNILGLFRDRFFAQKVPTDLLDTYFAAFRIPDLLFNVLILGTVSAAFIPIFLAERKRSEQAAWQLTHRAITLFLAALIVLAVILFLVMPLIVPYLVPDFSISKQLMTTNLARVLLLQPIFFTRFRSLLRRFFLPIGTE